MKNLDNPNKKKVKNNPEYLKEDYWFEIIKNLSKNYNEVPDPIQIRAAAIIESLGIPSGPYSSIELNAENKRKDEIITKYLINISGLIVNKNIGTVSHDFRDIYPDGLPKELKEVLDPNTLKIMEIEYEHGAWMQGVDMSELNKHSKGDATIIYTRLPGGVDLFLRGYIHYKDWQVFHQEFFKRINEFAKIIAIEGVPELKFNDKLNHMWENKNDYSGYHLLMHQAVANDFLGYFTTIDTRCSGKISFEGLDRALEKAFGFYGSMKISKFFVWYFKYLAKENPALIKSIKSEKQLEDIFGFYSTRNINEFNMLQTKDKRLFIEGVFRSKDGKKSFQPTFLENGQLMFADALAAIKWMLIGKLMADGYIEKGPMIDYEGIAHTNTKLFFLKHPQYAMEVVLRTIYELMAETIKEKNNYPEIYKMLDKPNWTKIFEQIVKLVFKKGEMRTDSKLIDVPIDFLKVYKIDSSRVIPSDEKIKDIRKLIRGINKKNKK